MAVKSRKAWRPFEDARAFARRLRLTNLREWQAFSSSGHRPKDIPSDPSKAYPDEFINWGDWLGTGNKRPKDYVFLPHAEARAFVHTLGLRTEEEWNAYAASEAKPENIPVNPRSYYGDDFKSMGDWLGTGNVAPKNRVHRPFVDARAFVHTLGLKIRAEWTAYCKSGLKPDDIPSDPWVTYGSEWKSMGDWLGTGRVANQRREFPPYGEACEIARAMRLQRKEDWEQFRRDGKLPSNLPSDPAKTYGSEWTSWPDFLGVVNHWRKTALLALLNDLRPRLHLLAETEIYTILERGGSLAPFRAALCGVSHRELIGALREDDGRTLERTLRGTTDEELQAQIDARGQDDGLADELRPESLLAEHLFEDHHGTPADSAPVQAAGQVSDELTQLDPALPSLTTPEGLRVLDSFSLALGSDSDAAEYLVVNRVAALWERYIAEGRAAIDEALDGDGGRYFQEIKSRFLGALEAVEALEVPAGWSFTANGAPSPPNTMQRRAAWAVLTKRRTGNWSGVGAGKTLSGALASRVIDARVTLVVTANTVISGWCAQILAAYPDSVIHKHVGDDLVLDRDRHNYIVLNYERFQTKGRDHLVRVLVNLDLDLVVFDEVQFVKQRDSVASLRRRALEALVCAAEEKNPELRVLGMSATPVINSLLEAKKLLEIVTGLGFPELVTTPTVKNALAMHRALMLHGFRYRPPYQQEMQTEIVTVSGNGLLEALREQGTSVLGVEQVLLAAKLDAIRPFLRPRTLVYSHYVNGMIAPIREYIEALGLRVGLGIGGDQSGLEAFKQGRVDVLVGSSPISTGVDGLQAVCDRVVMLSLPWTGAEYEQIIGRVRRLGSNFTRVEIVVPQVVLDWNGDTWSWDQGRLAAIQLKRTLSDCVTDAHIPEAVRMSPDVLYKLGREALERWIERIGAEGVCDVERQRLRVPLPPDLRRTLLARHGDFTVLNQRWSSSSSGKTHARLSEDTGEWYLYHSLYRQARASWPEIPCERIASRIAARPDWVVGDFGCGEALLAQALKNRVIGLDHVAHDETVLACDLAATPLEDDSLDVAVFSLSLMGVNWRDYLNEAHRALKPFGHLFIAETHRRWEGRADELAKAVTEAGFHIIGGAEQRYQFIYVEATKR